jgi:hypothetical protein
MKWKLVPETPTDKMVKAAREHHEGEAYLPHSLYKSMLASSPQPEHDSLNIELKKNNTPTEPGFYLFKNNDDYMPRLADIRNTDYGLDLVYTGGCYSLDRCGNGVLWSDKIEIIL